MAEKINAYDFGMRIKQLREDRGLSQAALAKKLEVSKETIYRYESNLQAPSLDRARQLAVILHTSLDYLAGMDDAYTVRLCGLSEQQKAALNDFLKAFTQN